MTDPRHREHYGLGYGAAEQLRLTQRRATRKAGFLLPHLRAGMRLLDCGCGPGSITLDLASVVAPGEAVGVDIEPRQIQAARELAARRGLANVCFGVADIYRLPFPDGSFDAAFAHTVLFHLRDPLQALREIRRVLRPGGVVGIRDPDAGTEIRSPSTPLLEQCAAILLRVAEYNGASPQYARHLRSLLLKAGFGHCEAYAVAFCAGNAEATGRTAKAGLRRLNDPEFVRVVTGQGWADEVMLDQMRAEVQQWGERPDTLYAGLDCAAVSWVDG